MTSSRRIPVKQDLRQEHPDRQSIEQARHADIVAHLSRGEPQQQRDQNGQRAHAGPVHLGPVSRIKNK